MVIRFAEINEYPLVRRHYEACGYGGGLGDNDAVVIAIDEQIIGAVRICNEYGLKILRGMYIKPSSQKKGTGSAMLKFLADNLDMYGCYCLPYKHLEAFYSIIGFQKILPEDAPEFLSKRLEEYLSKGSKEIIIMKIKNHDRS
jgi:GNAT superfamily N-acetyltransferase